MRKTRLLLPMLFLFMLSACTEAGTAGGQAQTAEEEARMVRTEYLAASGCAGAVEITADYGLRVYQYAMDFTWQREGETTITLTAPEELAGLTARVARDGTRLEFDGATLDTGALTEEGLTPLELVPTLMARIDGSYIAQSTFETLGETETLRVLLRDPNAQPGAGLECTLWFTRTEHALLCSELYWDGELVLSGVFSNFALQAGGSAAEDSE